MCKDYKVKAFLNSAQEEGEKKLHFFLKSPFYPKKKGAEKRPPYNLTTLMYQFVVKRFKGRLRKDFCQPHKGGVFLIWPTPVFMPLDVMAISWLDELLDKNRFQYMDPFYTWYKNARIVLGHNWCPRVLYGQGL